MDSLQSRGKLSTEWINDSLQSAVLNADTMQSAEWNTYSKQQNNDFCKSAEWITDSLRSVECNNLGINDYLFCKVQCWTQMLCRGKYRYFAKWCAEYGFFASAEGNTDTLQNGVQNMDSLQVQSETHGSFTNCSAKHQCQKSAKR